MSFKHFALLILLILAGCDPIAMHELQAPIQNDNAVLDLSGALDEKRLFETVHEIAKKYNMEIYEDSLSEKGSMQLHLFYFKDKFMIKVFEDKRNKQFIVHLADFPSFARSDMSKSVEKYLREYVPELTEK